MSQLQEPERRLHPLSILFSIAQHVRDSIIPLGITLLASRSGRTLLIGALILSVFGLVGSVWNWFTYRFRYGENDLVVRSGKLFRNERHIPYNRIQNIDAVQNIAHRFFGVAVVQVQTGSGSEPEATMNVLPLSALAEMRERVFAGRRIRAGEFHESEKPAAIDALGADSPVDSRSQPITLLHLPPKELLLAGLIENRGMALIVAAITALSRLDEVEERIVDRIFEAIPESVSAAFEVNATTQIAGVLVIFVVLGLAALLLVRVISTVWALVRLYNFTLVREGDDLRAEYGMFTRVTSTIPVRRVQTISLHQRLLHRRTSRAAIRVTTAGGAGMSGEGAHGREREWLAPIIPVSQVVPLLRQIDDSISFDNIEWQAAHPGAVWRLFRMTSIVGLTITAAAAYFVGWWSVPIAFACIVGAFARSRGVVRNLGAAVVDGRVFFRSGWFHRVTTVIRFERIQVASFQQSVFDRRTGMATISTDSAGAGSRLLRMPYLRREDAAMLHERLAEAAVRTPFTW